MGAPAILPNAGSLIPAHPAGVGAPGASPESRTRGFFIQAACQPGLDPGLSFADPVPRQRRKPRELDLRPERGCERPLLRDPRATAQLVRLCQQHGDGQLARLQPTQQLLVEPSHAAADIHRHDEPRE